jgi:DNA-nicking Smr family endonuclease
MMSGVVPLDGGPSRVPRSVSGSGGAPGERRLRAEDRAAVAAREAETVHEHLRTLADAPRFEVSDDGARVEGRRVDVLPDIVRKLRRGQFPIDARLDLHGRSAGDAREAVEAFLREKRARGERCVLVIHGKGEHAPGGIGVLRGEIAAWLAQGRASEHVAAFATATLDDGGEGALYVLLRR